MNLISARQCLIAWEPYDKDQPQKVNVGRLIGDHEGDWSAPFFKTGGAAYTRWRECPEAELTASVFITFNTLVVRDVVPVEQAHAEFCKIKEYPLMISPDIPGAVHAEELTDAYLKAAS